jgi:hypothetical protein
VKFELPGTHITTILNVPGALFHRNATHEKVSCHLKILLLNEVATEKRVMPLEDNVNEHYSHLKHTNGFVAKKSSSKK